MKLRALYWVIGLGLTGVVGYGYWQYHQAQLVLRLMDTTLQVANKHAQTEALTALHKMQQSIGKNQNQPQNQALLRQMEELCQRADKAAKAIAAIRHNLQLIGSAGPQKDGLTGTGERASREVLNYLVYLRQLITNLLDGKMTVLHTLAVESGKAGWPVGHSLSAGLALLTQQEATIREYERLALQYQREKIGCDRNIVYDSAGAFAAAESNTVAVGEKYKAKLFMASVYALPVLGMTVNGQPIAVGPDKHGHVEFAVPPDAGKASGGQAYWTGRIRTLVNGQDSTFTVKVAYTVRAN